MTSQYIIDFYHLITTTSDTDDVILNVSLSLTNNAWHRRCHLFWWNISLSLTNNTCHRRCHLFWWNVSFSLTNLLMFYSMCLKIFTLFFHTIFPIGYYLKFDIRWPSLIYARHKQDHLMLIHVLFRFNQFSDIWEKLCFHFLIWSCVKTLSCNGGHLGFLIPKQNKQLFRGPYKENACKGTNPSHKWLWWRCFFNIRHLESIIGNSRHVESE